MIEQIINTSNDPMQMNSCTAVCRGMNQKTMPEITIITLMVLSAKRFIVALGSTLTMPLT